MYGKWKSEYSKYRTMWKIGVVSSSTINEGDKVQGVNEQDKKRQTLFEN